MNARTETALVTGASAGFGADFARQLAPRLGQLVLVARRFDRLQTLSTEITALHSHIKVTSFQADLSLTSEIERLVTFLKKEKIEIDWLVNNAGLGDIGQFISSESGKVEHMIQVNVQALTLLTQALAPSMVARRSGKIINVASVAGYLALPGFAVYAATKAYVNSFSEALHWELHGSGVTVTCICPGGVQTEFGLVAVRPDNPQGFSPPAFLEISSAQVAHESIQAALQGKPRHVPGLMMKIGAFIVSLLPLWWLRILYRLKIIAY